MPTAHGHRVVPDGLSKTNGKVRSRVTSDVALVGLRKAISWAVRRGPGQLLRPG